jgi:GR25 family glycosyltransferase involved in LPS biosynthesis
VSGVVASCGEDGCRESHLSILEKQDEFPFAVFEDDCILMKPWCLVDEVMKQLPKDWDALWLGGNVRSKLDRYSHNLFKLKDTYALHAVIYNSERMVDYILENHNTASGINLDVFYGREVQQKFNCFIIYPMVANQRKGYSDITKREVDYYDELLEIYNKQTG